MTNCPQGKRSNAATWLGAKAAMAESDAHFMLGEWMMLIADGSGVGKRKGEGGLVQPAQSLMWSGRKPHHRRPGNLPTNCRTMAGHSWRERVPRRLRRRSGESRNSKFGGDIGHPPV